MNHYKANREEQVLEFLFSEIFREYEQRLYTLALRLTSSDQYAKDIVQDVFLKLWQNREQLSTIENMDAWLYRITEDKTIDFLRKAATDNRLREKIWRQLRDKRQELELTPVSSEYNEIIDRAIDRLPPRRRRIYRLFREDTVKSQLSTAVKAIRQFVTRSSRV